MVVGRGHCTLAGFSNGSHCSWRQTPNTSHSFSAKTDSPQGLPLAALYHQ